MQVNEVKICFTANGNKYSFDPNNINLKIGDKVIVETARGLEIGTVCSEIKKVDAYDGKEPFKKVLRFADKQDFERKELNHKKEKEILDFCEEQNKKLNIDMKVISVSLTLDASKVVICFTADDRVDFRELVKVLANEFKMRIELKQVDARESTKIMGGLGPCGQECCCSKFLDDPIHSSIKMAKNQNMSLNPNNISGLCGKLKCCLAYENDFYVGALKKMPPVNSIVTTKDGEGVVAYNNLFKEISTVKFTNGDNITYKDYPANELKVIGKSTKGSK